VLSLSAGTAAALADQAPPAQGTPEQGVPQPQPPTHQQPPAPSDPPPPSDPPAAPAEPTVLSMSGELTAVDTEKKTLTVKGSDGTETIFIYNDDTKVSGSQENVAGLATASGATVMVEYTKTGDDLIATSIKVEAKS
jgi:hypothetical protein